MGSCFHFELTFVTVDEVINGTNGKNGKEVEMPEFEGEVLVCEDNVLNQHLITDHLMRVGLKTVIAANGKEGIDIISSRMRNQEKPFDLIFMDIHMPVLDGFKTAPLMKKMGVRAPIIALTANIMSQDIELYRASGMFDVVGKPYTSLELWTCLKKYLPVKEYTPVSPDVQSAEDEKILTIFKTNFVKANRETFIELVNAIRAKDRKLAHRIAHTLKSVAGQINEKNLQAAAADVEHVFTKTNLMPDELLLKKLEIELHVTLEKYAPLLLTAKIEPLTDKQEILRLLDKLEPLLVEGNTESLHIADALSETPGMETLVEYIRDFNFPKAFQELGDVIIKL